MRTGLLVLPLGLLPLLLVAAPAMADGIRDGKPPVATEPDQAAAPTNALGSAGLLAADRTTDSDTPAAKEDGPQPSTSPWAGTVEFYGFAPLRTSGTATVQGLSTDFDLDLGQVLRPLTGIAYVGGSVEYGRIGLLTDLSYLSLQGAEGRTSGDIQLNRSLGPLDRSSASLSLSGPRNTISLDGPPRGFSRYGAFRSTIAQPLLGTQAMVFLSPRLRLFARADIGGFGIDQPDNMSWNTQTGLGYAIGNSTQLNLSWRLLHLGGSNGGTPQNAYLINENGMELGVTFFF